MSYSGNPSLSQDTQDRIISTFGQTLDLAREGRRQEAKLGCDFILKMDPLFQPARQLQERLENGDGPVDVSDLQEAAASDMPATEVFSQPLDEPLPDPVLNPEPAGGEGSGALSLDTGALELPSLEPPFDSGPLTLDGGPAAARPAPPAPSPAATSEGGAAAEGGQRIAELLEEGQAAFEASEYQKAIDAWSRIFLIDIDHQEAARRIEQARKLKAELERQLDETFHQAMAERQAGRIDEARIGFEKVLELQPNHLAAKEQLQQLDNPQPEPTRPSLVPPPADDLIGEPAAEPPLGEDDVFNSDFDAMMSEESTTLTVPPAELGKGGAAKPQRSLFVLGLLVLAVAAVAGWYLYGRWGSFFPSEEEPPPAAVPVVDVVQRANRLHLGGETERAIAELRKLEPDHPAYGRAQVLIEQWESEPGLVPDPPPEELPEDAVVEEATEDELGDRRGQLLSLARLAYREAEYLRAARAFKAADDISPLDGAAADLFEDTKNQLRPIAQQIDLFRQREWEMVIPVLWRKLKDEPDNKDLARILTDSYYNLGIRDLRRGVPSDAEAQFQEAVALRPDDEGSKKLLHFSQAYQQIPRDVLYQIYVKQLKYRR